MRIPYFRNINPLNAAQFRPTRLYKQNRSILFSVEGRKYTVCVADTDDQSD